MTIADNTLDKLCQTVKERLSIKRYEHTLGVMRAALKLSEYCLPDDKSELCVAALLHDITKEYPTELHHSIIKDYGISVTESDLIGDAVLHSITAPSIILRDFPEYATDKVISAVKNHTVGAPDMSLFDEIIFVADFIEDGRTYPSCIKVRESLYDALTKAKDREECICLLHDAVIESIDLTIMSIIRDGRYLNERAVQTRNAFLGRKPISLN